jgi:hypothetical protein
MTWAALQASEYANGSVGLAALDADASVAITGWAQPVVMVPNADKTYWQAVSGFFTLARKGFATLNSFTGCNAAITWTLAADPANGKTRITASGAHGWTSSVNGKCADITAWSGTGAAGLYELTYVDGTNMDLSVAYSAGYGNPTVSPLNTETALYRVSVPAVLMQESSQIRLASQWKHTTSTNGRYCIIRMDTLSPLFVTSSNVSGTTELQLVSNTGDTSAQIAQKNDGLPIGGSNVHIGAVATASGFDLVFAGKPQIVNEYVEIAHIAVEICI